MSRQLFPVVVLILLLGCLALAGGCGGPGETTVSGDVILDDQPLREGTIRFSPVEGETPTAAAPIKDGRFEARLYCTTYRVEISAPKPPKNPSKVTDQHGLGGGDLVEELIPPRYNRNSKLTLEVRQARKDVRFDLKSK